MAINVTQVFRRHAELYDEEMAEMVRDGESPFDLPGLKLVRTTESSKSINNIRGTAVILAGTKPDVRPGRSRLQSTRPTVIR